VAPDCDASGAAVKNAAFGVVAVIGFCAVWALALEVALAFVLGAALALAAAVLADGTEARVAVPVTVRELAAEPLGAEARTMLALPVFGAGGGQDRVTDVTAADCAAALALFALDPEPVPHAIT
jgi:hypothetical protein